MADISGRRDRNKKSPGVHYDMHRCTRGCDLHCFAAERNVEYRQTRRGRAESPVCVYVLRVRVRVPNRIEQRSTWWPRSADTAGHWYSIWKRFSECYLKHCVPVRYILHFCTQFKRISRLFIVRVKIERKEIKLRYINRARQYVCARVHKRLSRGCNAVYNNKEETSRKFWFQIVDCKFSFD